MADRQGTGLSRTRTDPVNPVADHLGFLLRRCQTGMFDHLAREVRAYDLRPTEYAVLGVVRENRHIRPSRLGETLGIKLGNLSPLLDRLEDRGLLLRRRAADDQRAIELRLTAAGRALHTRLTRAVDAHVGHMRARLGESDYERLTELLQRLLLVLDTGEGA